MRSAPTLPRSRRLIAASTLALLAAAALALLAACGGSAPTASDAPPARIVRADGPAGLVNTMELSATRLSRGDVLTITSTVENRGAAAVALESYICGLEVRDAETFRAPDEWARCAGYSQGGEIAPGATRVESERILVGGSPGTYTFRVRHLIDPAVWVTATVEVR